MSKTYYTYRIRIANSQSVEIEKLDFNNNTLGRSRGILSLAEKLTEGIEELLEDTREYGLNNSKDVKLLGEALFDIIFDDTLRRDFIDFYQERVNKQEQLVRIEIDIDEQYMPEVAALPWEFMCIPESANAGTVWLAATPNIVLSRRRVQWNSPQIRSDEKLRIALVISAPSDLGPVAYQRIQTLLENLVQQQPHLIELLPVVNPANSQEINNILEKKPNIFHFIGHGSFKDRNGKEIGQVALVGQSGKAEWVDSGFFSGLFNRYHPNVVILHACEGGTLSSSKAFVGVASKVVQQNIPIVVAMQYNVTNKTANDFAQYFYKQLLQGVSIDLSVQEARQIIGTSSRYNSRDFATPVIFTSVQDTQFFKPKPIRQKVFISYSREDNEWLEKLQRMLTPLRRAGKISVWNNTEIKAGQITEEETTNALAEAKIAVLLVSDYYLASDDIFNRELSPLLKAAEQEGLRIIWICVSDCLYKENEIDRYKAAHDINQPLDTLSQGDLNRVLADIARKILQAADS